LLWPGDETSASLPFCETEPMPTLIACARFRQSHTGPTATAGGLAGVRGDLPGDSHSKELGVRVLDRPVAASAGYARVVRLARLVEATLAAPVAGDARAAPRLPWPAGVEGAHERPRSPAGDPAGADAEDVGRSISADVTDVARSCRPGRLICIRRGRQCECRGQQDQGEQTPGHSKHLRSR
jgi:hypothetical protein